jgi:hypothetical protein
MKVSVEFNAQGVKSKIDGNVKRVQFVLDQQVAKDSNYFCPEDLGYSGGLMGSVIPSAGSGKGLLEWNEVYAKAQYYGLPNKSKDKNPNAAMKWFERAKALWVKKWERLVNAEYSR